MIKKADCHVHMLLSGKGYKADIARHRDEPNTKYIREVLQSYADAGIYYIRDGGDKYGVCTKARDWAPEYGICYLTPVFPIFRLGCYGSFLGEGFEYENDLYRLVKEIKSKKANFMKIMASGIADFDNFGQMLKEGPDAKTIKEMVHIGHEEGLKVMAHASGERWLEAAIEAGADSIEHGFYMNRDCLIEMSERGTIWVPTIATIGNLTKNPDCPEAAQKLLKLHMDNVAKAASMGVKIACGSDAGCGSVCHIDGQKDEMEFLCEALGENAQNIITEGNDGIFKNFV